MIHRAFRSQIRTPVGERIRRDVEYAHDTAWSSLWSVARVRRERFGRSRVTSGARHRHGRNSCWASAAVRVLRSSIAIVIGPTPPGTG